MLVVKVIVDLAQRKMRQAEAPVFKLCEGCSGRHFDLTRAHTPPAAATELKNLLSRGARDPEGLVNWSNTMIKRKLELSGVAPELVFWTCKPKFGIRVPRPGNEIENSSSQVENRSRISREGACFQKVLLAFFSVRLASRWPASSQKSCSHVCASTSQVVECRVDQQAASLRFSGRLVTWDLHCVREVVSGLNRLVDWTTSAQFSDGSIGKPGKGLRFCSVCAGARRFSLRPVVHLSCALPAYVGHTVCLSACVCHMHALRHFGDAKSPHMCTPLVVQIVDAQSRFWEQPTGQAVSCTILEQSSKHEKKFLFLRSPCSWSSNKKADKLFAADVPWSKARRRFLFLRQANRKKDARKPQSLVRRFAERSSNPKFGTAIFASICQYIFYKDGQIASRS